MSGNEKFVPVENLLKMPYLEQYVQHVVSYSSRYNNSSSYSYAPINLVGKYGKYPSYGDFPEAYFLRSYGTWWKNSKSAQEDYRPQDFDLLAAEDFVTLEFGSAVVPRDLCIYEVYNPGSVVRIWGGLLSHMKWHLLWEGFPEKCAKRSRKFCPPLRKVNCLVNLIRIEFNQSHLEYHTSIDAVLLGGFQPQKGLQYKMIEKGLAQIKIFKSVGALTVSDIEPKSDCDQSTIDYFSILPNEIILHIFQYLDLKSLSICAQVNRRLNELCQDQTLYQNISLKIFWNLVNVSTLNYLLNKVSYIKKLDLSWCNETQIFFHHRLHFDYHKKLASVIEGASKTLTHLSLNDNYFVDGDVIQAISYCKELVDLRLHHTFNWIRAPLYGLNKLVTLDLSLTHINDGDLLHLLKCTPQLEHLILDLCENLLIMDTIVEHMIKYNTAIKTFSSWKTISFTSDGIKKFRYCENLEELDLGWCLVNIDPGDCLSEIAMGCKKLRRLILSEWRGVSDQSLMPIILSCKELHQLDLLGLKNITSEVCEKALFLLPKLRLLDISFCDSVPQREVDIWRQQYPHITIQRSCEYAVTDYL